MRIYGLVARRILLAVPVLFGVTVITFAVSHLVKGDPARALAGIYADQTTIEAVRHKWGLDRPLLSQYFAYVRNVAEGNLGTSTQTSRPVMSDIVDRLPATLELTLCAFVLMCVLGISFGVVAAVNQNRLPDHLARLVAVIGSAVPSFWLALVLLLLFYGKLGWLPATGRLSDGVSPPHRISGLYVVDGALEGEWNVVVDALKHLVLPAFTLAFAGIAGVTRLTRASMLDVLGRDYIRAAQARGLRPRVIVSQHALKNAIIPTVTLVGLLFGAMIGGAFVIEFVFAWPGIGSYAASAITSLDYAAIMGVALLAAVIYLVANLLVDISYILLNPRVREG
jgi:ABC-type dipeptide/oligopeptide/nickel transport system permease component